MSGQRTQEQVTEELAKALDEVNEILAKSGYGEMRKEDPAAAPGTDEMAPHAEPAPEAAPEGAPAPEAPAPDAAPAEGQDDHAAMEAQAKELSDQELDMMLDILMAEKEGRHGAGEPGAEGAPAPEAPADGAPAEPAEKAMKDEFKKLAKANKRLAKSVEDAVAAMVGMKQEVEALKKSQPAPAPAPAQTAKPATVTRAAATTSSQATQVLRKSTEPTKRLTKSETMDFAMSKLRQDGSKSGVNRDVIAEINLSQNDQELAAIQDKMAKQGFVWPELK